MQECWYVGCPCWDVSMCGVHVGMPVCGVSMLGGLCEVSMLEALFDKHINMCSTTVNMNNVKTKNTNTRGHT